MWNAAPFKKALLSFFFLRSLNCVRISVMTEHCKMFTYIRMCTYARSCTYQIILGECRALWGERSEAWYRVTVAADAEAATYVKRVYVDYL